MPTTPAPTTAISRPPMADSLPRLGVGLELHRPAVHAIALARGLRTVVEDVAQMPAAAVAVDLGARQDELEVPRCLDHALERREEAPPTPAAVEVGLRPTEL